MQYFGKLCFGLLQMDIAGTESLFFLWCVLLNASSAVAKKKHRYLIELIIQKCIFITLL